jgi:hypothetical protein
MNTGGPQEQALVRHDALEFPNGRIILLARLCEGQQGPCYSCRFLRAQTKPIGKSLLMRTAANR